MSAPQRLGDAMGDYRAYILGAEAHRFVLVEDFPTDHPNDTDALDAARRLSQKHDVEVWDGGRLVALLSASGVEAPPALAPSFPADCLKIAVEPAEPAGGS
jgi:hypothetical protein